MKKVTIHLPQVYIDWLEENYGGVQTAVDSFVREEVWEDMRAKKQEAELAELHGEEPEPVATPPTEPPHTELEASQPQPIIDTDGRQVATSRNMPGELFTVEKTHLYTRWLRNVRTGQVVKSVKHKDCELIPADQVQWLKLSINTWSKAKRAINNGREPQCTIEFKRLAKVKNAVYFGAAGQCHLCGKNTHAKLKNPLIDDQHWCGCTSTNFNKRL